MIEDEPWEQRPAHHLIGTPNQGEVDRCANIFGVKTGRVVAYTIQRQDAEQIVADHNRALLRQECQRCGGKLHEDIAPVQQLQAEIMERAEAALKTSAEAYRLAQEAVDMRAERDAALAENERLREALWIHGEHRPTCRLLKRGGNVCSCGLGAFFAE